MCGLFGFIGSSKNNELTEYLSTALFVKTQSRGLDASGFYCVTSYPEKTISYYKKPVPATEFIQLDEYKSIWKKPANLGLFHCRAASVGVGIPAYNENNHPFVSKCNKKAVIHNGVISRKEYDYLKTYYEVETDCDSEIFLRILEQEESFINKAKSFLYNSRDSHYAVAYAEAEDKSRKLHLFRNEHRPLVLINLLEELGQIFFCSTPSIFFESLDLIKTRIRNYKLYEIPHNNYIELTLDENSKLDLNEYSFSVDWQNMENFETEYHPIKNDKSLWKNLVSVQKNEDILDVILGMSEKLKQTCNSINDKIQKLENKQGDKQKINSVFNFLKEMNKRCDLLNRTLGD